MEGNNVFFILGGLALLGVGIAIGVTLFKRNAPDSVEKPVFEALMLVALALRTIFSEAELEAVAGYLYDQGFSSNYYTKEQFVSLVKRVFAMLEVDKADEAKKAVDKENVSSTRVGKGDEVEVDAQLPLFSD